MSFPTLSRLAVAERLTNESGKPLVLTKMLGGLLAALDDPTTFECLLHVVRQTGKSTACATGATTELLTVPNSYTVLVAASEAQQQAIFARKLKKPLDRLLKTLGLHDVARFTRNSVEIPELNSAIVVLASNEQTAPGRTVTLLIIDEGRDVATSVYTALAPSVIGAGGKVVVASTSGRPVGFFYDLMQNPTAQTWVYASTENDNPHADQGVLDFLRRRLGLIAPSAMRRELENEFVDDADAFLSTALIDAAVDDTLGELPSSSLPAFAFLDLSRKRDLTSLVVVVREEPRRPEASDHLVVASVQTWDPRQSPTGEVDFAEVRGAIGMLPRRFPGLGDGALLVDEGAEAGTVLPWARQHPRLSLVVKGFTGSAATNMQLWSALAARLHARTVSIPRHERLLSELRNLRQESFAFGQSYRIVDGTRKLHRDVSLALAGACLGAGEEDDMPLMLLSSDPNSSYQQWQALHTRGSSAPEDEPEGGDDDPTEVIEATEEEMAARPDAADWERFIPRAEKRRRHHADLLATVKRDGYWDPRDA